MEKEEEAVNEKHDNAVRAKGSPYFTHYYRDLQRIAGEDPQQWEALELLFKSPLPTSFWINDTDPIACVVARRFRQLAAEVEETQKAKLIPVDWYPQAGMAWKLEVDKQTLRKDPALSQLREFLIQQTANGSISRQEEVSMIPVFLLQIQAHDTVLDMCSSPGSKTAQLLVELGRQKRKTADSSAGVSVPFDYTADRGAILANELDAKRANMLIYQVKRLRKLFPFVLFTNHDARVFPDCQFKDGTPLKFDKILCDVVCTGDGTLRKAPHLFKRWSAGEALTLHRTQIQIAYRGCQMLKVGGRIVYSTCSLNPIENEAVVSQLLLQGKGSLSLVDVTQQVLPRLQHDKGMNMWVVANHKGEEVRRGEAGSCESYYPLSEEARTFLASKGANSDMSCCVRMLPHHVNGGGFFIAVLEKRSEMEVETLTPEMITSLTWKKRGAAKDKEANAKSPAEQVHYPTFPVTPDLREAIQFFFNAQNFPVENLVLRGAVGDVAPTITPHSTAYFLSTRSLQIVMEAGAKLTVVSAGLRTFARERMDNSWRITNEAAFLFYPFMRQGNSSRLLQLPSNDLVRQMIAAGPLKDVPFEDIKDETFRKTVEDLTIGSALLMVPTGRDDEGVQEQRLKGAQGAKGKTEDVQEEKKSGEGHLVPTVVLRARKRIQLFVDEEDIDDIKFRLGIE